MATLEEFVALRYALAPLCVAVAVLLHLSAIGSFLHPTGLFLASVVAAAWFGGAAPGLLAALLATLVLPQLIEMSYPLVADFFDLPRFLTFGLAGVAVGWGTAFRRRAEAALRQSQQELREARNELERKVAERTIALRFSEERYARAMDGSDAGHWDWNIENDEMFVSARAQEMLGLGAGPLPAKRAEIMPLVAMHPEDRQSMAKTVEASIASGSHEHDYRVITASGDVRWLHSRAKVFRGDGGEPVRMTGSVSDVTERKEADDKLKRSEAFLAEAQRLSLTGSFGWNVASGELFWSDETYEIVGLDRGTKPTLDEVLRRVHPEDLAFVQDALGRATREREALDFEHRFLLDDSSVKHVRVRARATTSDRR
jgi:PAS domain S-box-containing protein